MPLVGMAGSSVMMMPVLEALQVAIELGFDAFEVFGEFPQCVCDELSDAQLSEIRKLAESAGITLCLHAPFNSLNIAALNPGARREALRQVLSAIDACSTMGGKTVIVHNGDYLLSPQNRGKYPQAFEVQWKFNSESLTIAAQRAQEQNITLCLENIGFEPHVIDRNVEDLLAIREAVNNPALAFCLDIGHARLNGELEKALSQMGSLIRHVHFTDNFGEKDDHLILGHGNFDYTPCLDFINKFDGVVTLEVINIGRNPEPARLSLEYFKKKIIKSS